MESTAVCDVRGKAFVLASVSACWLTTILITACASPTTQQGSVSRLDVQNEAIKQQQLVIETDWKSQTRLQKVALPLLKAARPLCGQRLAIRSGVYFANASSYPKDWQIAARLSGLGDSVSIVSVTPGSSAERAGLQFGDRIVGIADTPVGVGASAVPSLGSYFDSHYAARPVTSHDHSVAAGPSVRFAFAVMPLNVVRNGTPLSLVVPMDTVCDFKVIAQRSDEINAAADGQNVYVTTAMLHFADDDELETVVAHEIGHNVMHHMDAKKKNALLGGIFGAVMDVAMAAGGVNTGGAYTNQMMSAGAQAFSQDFEREADYVGSYILALSNLDYGHAANVWRHMATESPGSIKFAKTHPTTAERFVRLEATAKEIDAKKAANQPLMPNMKSRK